VLARRLRHLPTVALHGPLTGVDAHLASTARARLLGLAALDIDAVAGVALLLPRTRSIHTFGMRAALDLVWLDADGRAVRVDRAVPPRRLRACHAAREVLELPAGATPPALRPGARVCPRRAR
jgi:uncharacterized membrane protein (UPF0127 family)